MAADSHMEKPSAAVYGADGGPGSYVTALVAVTLSVDVSHRQTHPEHRAHGFIDRLGHRPDARGQPAIRTAGRLHRGCIHRSGRCSVVRSQRTSDARCFTHVRRARRRSSVRRSAELLQQRFAHFVRSTCTCPTDALAASIEADAWMDWMETSCLKPVSGRLTYPRGNWRGSSVVDSDAQSSKSRTVVIRNPASSKLTARTESESQFFPLHCRIRVQLPIGEDDATETPSITGVPISLRQFIRVWYRRN